jgi:hypothetical protein
MLEVDKSRLAAEIIETEKRTRIEEAKKFEIEKKKYDEEM